jgi:hypothetical protein
LRGVRRAALALVLVLAACGGDGDDDQTPAADTTTTTEAGAENGDLLGPRSSTPSTGPPPTSCTTDPSPWPARPSR